MGMSYPLTPEITIPLTWNLVQRFFMVETFKKCPEVPASCPDFDDISTFSTVTTDLPEDHSVPFWSRVFDVICSFECSMWYSSWSLMVIIWLFSELLPLFPTSAANKLVSVVFKWQISFPWPINDSFEIPFKTVINCWNWDIVFFPFLHNQNRKLILLGTCFEKLWPTTLWF